MTPPLTPELQRYKDTVSCGKLSLEVPEHPLEQLMQTSIVSCENTLVFIYLKIAVR